MFEQYQVNCDSCDSFKLVNPIQSHIGAVIGSRIHEYRTGHQTEIEIESMF